MQKSHFRNIADVGLLQYYKDMNRIKPASGEIYHVYNRGVEKRRVFMNEQDYLRFIHDLFEFNDQEPAGKIYKHTKEKQFAEVELPQIREPRKFIVDILAFCLMPNHFHLLLHQKNENGITEFMRKLGAGYTNYFNNKYERVGALFQGIYKTAHVHNEEHFLYLPYYIHLNPLDLVAPEWRDGEIPHPQKAISFLDSYRWSSYLDYSGQKNFPSVTQREFVLSLFNNNQAEYKNSMLQWLEEHGVEEVESLALE